jgi:hypothetical protein
MTILKKDVTEDKKTFYTFIDESFYPSKNKRGVIVRAIFYFPNVFVQGNITIKYLTRDHKRPQSIYGQYVEIYSKVTKKTLTMPLKELQEGLKSDDWSQKLADTLLKSTFGQSNELKRALN